MAKAGSSSASRVLAPVWELKSRPGEPSKSAPGRMGDDLLIRGEYLHSFFDSERYSFPLDAPHTHDIEFDTDVVRGAIIWKF